MWIDMKAKKILIHLTWRQKLYSFGIVLTLESHIAEHILFYPKLILWKWWPMALFCNPFYTYCIGRTLSLRQYILCLCLTFLASVFGTFLLYVLFWPYLSEDFYNFLFEKYLLTAITVFLFSFFHSFDDKTVICRCEM